jgi:hypothetical protein
MQHEHISLSFRRLSTTVLDNTLHMLRCLGQKALNNLKKDLTNDLCHNKSN